VTSAGLYFISFLFTVKASALVLLQTVPFHIQVRKLQERLLLEVSVNILCYTISTAKTCRRLYTNWYSLLEQSSDYVEQQKFIAKSDVDAMVQCITLQHNT